MTKYPKATWLPWLYIGESGRPAYYRGLNDPKAVVLHRMQGWYQTAVQWAATGYASASWHFTVGLDGRVAQHLEFEDGGYHAGIANSPTWALYSGGNPNLYSIGIECEGFANGEWPEAQLVALRDLCQWLAVELDIPLDHDHFPAHAEIDQRDRFNDFDTPERRDAIVYPYLFEEEELSAEDKQLLYDLARRLLVGTEEGQLVDADQALDLARYRASTWAANRSVADVTYSNMQNLEAHQKNHCRCGDA